MHQTRRGLCQGVKSMPAPKDHALQHLCWLRQLRVLPAGSCSLCCGHTELPCQQDMSSVHGRAQHAHLQKVARRWPHWSCAGALPEAAGGHPAPESRTRGESCAGGSPAAPPRPAEAARWLCTKHTWTLCAEGVQGDAMQVAQHSCLQQIKGCTSPPTHLMRQRWC